MKLTAILEESAMPFWKEAAAKPFVTKMADGTLAPELFRRYMLQDYLYLQDYIEILRQAKDCAAKPSLVSFIDQTIEETENETYRVHIPNMRAIGITDEDVRGEKKLPVIAEYISYMQGQLREEGLLGGLTALLQCSWVYAYLGGELSSSYADKLPASSYKSWFDAYTCLEYLQANQRWIEVVDDEARAIDQGKARELCNIFTTCAEYENKLWDALMLPD